MKFGTRRPLEAPLSVTQGARVGVAYYRDCLIDYGQAYTTAGHADGRQSCWVSIGWRLVPYSQAAVRWTRAAARRELPRRLRRKAFRRLRVAGRHAERLAILERRRDFALVLANLQVGP